MRSLILWSVRKMTFINIIAVAVAAIGVIILVGLAVIVWFDV